MSNEAPTGAPTKKAPMFEKAPAGIYTDPPNRRSNTALRSLLEYPPWPGKHCIRFGKSVSLPSVLNFDSLSLNPLMKYTPAFRCHGHLCCSHRGGGQNFFGFWGIFEFPISF